MEDTNQKLRAATRALNQEEFQKAIELLEEILRADQDNVKAWWLMANAVDSPEEAREALEIVLELDPDHAEARSMLDQLLEMYPEEVGGSEPGQDDTDELAMLAEAMQDEEDEIEPDDSFDILEPEPVEPEEPGDPEEPGEPDWLAFADEAPREVLDDAETTGTSVFDDVPTAFDTEEEEDIFDDFDFEDDDFFDDVEDEDEFDDFIDEDDTFDLEEDFDLDEDTDKAPSRGWRRFLLPVAVLALVVVIVAVIAVVMLGGGGDDGSPQPGETPTAPTSDRLDVLREAHGDSLAALGDALADAGYEEASAEFRETAEGPTLMGQFCWSKRGGWSEAALEAMGLVTEAAQPMSDEGLAAVGVELRFCGSEDVLFARMAPLDLATDFYIEQDSTEEDFVATWVEP